MNIKDRAFIRGWRDGLLDVHKWQPARGSASTNYYAGSIAVLTHRAGRQSPDLDRARRLGLLEAAK